jgi:hypothetical protein
MGALDGNAPVSDNEWEKVKAGGDAAIEKWIADQMAERSVTVVLIGANTAGRKWITHEISKSWNKGMGVVGVYIHNLKDQNGATSLKGGNPLDHVTFKADGKKLSTVAKVYDPPSHDSTQVYLHIAFNLDDWVEEAISIRKNHK